MARPGAFTTGSILRHILVMTGTGAVGLIAIFIGDLANILFLSMLGDVDVVAAVGYASSILFLTISVGIGLGIGATSVIAPALGTGHRVRARRLTASAHAVTAAAAAIISIAVWLASPSLLKAVGASGRPLDLATDYLRIMVPFLVPLATAMTSSAVLRSVGDARRAMHVTLTGAILNIILDPIFIFGFGLGIHGAAMASGIARVAIVAVGLWGVVRIHGLMGRLKLRTALQDGRRIAQVAVPAILTNVATPAANAYVTAAIAPFGDQAVAGFAIIGRIMPVAFGAIYALSGSIGPIVGQNFGIGDRDRLRQTVTWSLVVTLGFTMAAWVVLALMANPLISLFKATGQTADLIALFCRVLSPFFAFLGFIFVANAVFNTLGRPHFATVLNWARATLGTIPFVMLGARAGGAEGVVAANMLGAIPFGLLAIVGCYRLAGTVEKWK